MNRSATTMSALKIIGIIAVLSLIENPVFHPAFAEPRAANAQNTGMSSELRKDHDLHPGDTVRLKSGSPLMTVDSVQGDDANCRWATEYGELFTATFPIATLMVVGGPGWLPPEAPDRYHPCPSSVEINGRVTCLY